MIIAVTEQFHDYQPRLYLLDTTKLVEENPVDAEILAATKLPGATAKVYIDGTKYQEPCVSQQAVVETGASEKSIYLKIQFE